MPGKIFLNYRRSDAEAWADRLYERLGDQLPDAEIFMDIDGDIPLGVLWTDWLDNQVAECDLMLVLIGRTWATEFNARSDLGGRDHVVAEIRSALSRAIPVVPVFLGDTPVPSRSDLPESIRPLLDHQAVRLRRGAIIFDADAKSLIEGVRHSIQLRSGSRVQTNKPNLSAFRREFWAHMLKRHPSEGDYRKAYAASSRWQDLPDYNLVLVQFISQNGAGVFFRCPRSGDDKEAVALLKPHARQLERGLSAAMNADYPRFLFLKKLERDALDKRSWDEIADWLHAEAESYIDVIMTVIVR